MEINKEKIINSIINDVPEFFADYAKTFLEKYYDKLMNTSIGRELKSANDIEKRLIEPLMYILSIVSGKIIGDKNKAREFFSHIASDFGSEVTKRMINGEQLSLLNKDDILQNLFGVSNKTEADRFIRLSSEAEEKWLSILEKSKKEDKREEEARSENRKNAVKKIFSSIKKEGEDTLDYLTKKIDSLTNNLEEKRKKKGD